MWVGGEGNIIKEWIQKKNCKILHEHRNLLLFCHRNFLTSLSHIKFISLFTQKINEIRRGGKERRKGGKGKN